MCAFRLQALSQYCVSVLQISGIHPAPSRWRLNAHMYEHDTGLFHWEWAFQVEG